MKPLPVHWNVLKAALVVLAVILVAVLAWQGGAWNVRAMDAPQTLPPPQPPAPTGPTAGPVACIITYINATASGVVVQCSQPVVGTVIWQFGLPVGTASDFSINRMLALITTAYSLGKPLNVFYSTDTLLNPAGCQASTCRRMDGVYIIQ